MSFTYKAPSVNFKEFHNVSVENIIPLPQIFVEILLRIKKTGLPGNLLHGTCVTCKRNKSLIVSDQTMNGEGLGDFFKQIGKIARNVGKKIPNSSARALKIAANIGTAAAIAPDFIKFVHQRKAL